MTTVEVLKTARALAGEGYSPETCSIGDWPEAADAFIRANWWRPIRWMPLQTRGMLVRAFTRAIRLAESEAVKAKYYSSLVK